MAPDTPRLVPKRQLYRFLESEMAQEVDPPVRPEVGVVANLDSAREDNGGAEAGLRSRVCDGAHGSRPYRLALRAGKPTIREDGYLVDEPGLPRL